MSATKDKTTYIDNFSIYYNGKEGGPDMPGPGDVNGDGEINIADVNTVIVIILGGNADEDTMRRADVNCDSEVNVADINSIIDLILR